MTAKYYGKRKHDCFGDIKARPVLARRAQYFGWGLNAVTQNTVSEPQPWLVHYEVYVEGTGEVVRCMTPSELGEWLAQQEEAQVDAILSRLPSDHTLQEELDELGARVGFSVYLQEFDAVLVEGHIGEILTYCSQFEELSA